MAKNECEKLLANGVFEHHFGKTSDTKDSDYKSYFKSEQFKKDFENGKFNFGVEAVFEGIPFKLDFGSDETRINEFIEKVEKSVSFTMTSTFYQEYSYTVPNKDLAAEYRKCLEKNKLGFNIEHELTDDSITFHVTYNNFGKIGQNPKLEGVFISSSGRLKNQTIKIGEELENLQECSFTFELTKNIRSLIFTIDTDFSAQSEKVEFGKAGIDNNQPIGTIISSFLNWKQFEKATDNNKFSSNGLWNGKQSFWAPCDGRKVVNSYFHEISNDTEVPDLRGIFLRGLNVFDKDELDNGVSVVKPDQKDPEPDRYRGKLQGDAFKSHQHIISQNRGAYYDKDGPDNAGFIANAYQGNWGNAGSSWEGDKDETRPKNRAVYYYIKIN
jgi:hypothetical protein